MVTIGLVGHVDAGKSTLVKILSCLTYVDREIGQITQDVRCVVLEQAYLDRLCGGTGGAILLIDVPGHTAFGTSRAISVAVADVVAVVIELGRRVPAETLELMRTLEGVPYCVIFTKRDLFTENSQRQALQELLMAGLLVEHYASRKDGHPYFTSGLGLIEQVLAFLRFCRRIKTLGKKFVYLQSVITAGRTLGVFFSRGYTTEEIRANGHVRFESFFSQPYTLPRPTREVGDGLWGAKFKGRLIPGTELSVAEVLERADGLVVKSSGEARLAAILTTFKKEGIPVMYASVGAVTKNYIQFANEAGPFNRFVVGFNVKTPRHPLVIRGEFIHEIVAVIHGLRLERLKQKLLQQFGPCPVTCLKPILNAVFFRSQKMLIAGFQVVAGTLEIGMKFTHDGLTAEVVDIEVSGKKVLKATSSHGKGTGVGVCFKPAIAHQYLYQGTLSLIFTTAKKYLPGITRTELIQLLMA
jgi:small GTP-binding protein